MSYGNSVIIYLVTLFTFFAPASMFADDPPGGPPIELPPLKVVGTTPGVFGFVIICEGINCQTLFGETLYQQMMNEAQEAPEDNGTIYFSIKNVDDWEGNPVNNTSCSAASHDRELHASKDIARANLPIVKHRVGDVVRVTYDNDDTELHLITSLHATYLTQIVPGSCNK